MCAAEETVKANPTTYPAIAIPVLNNPLIHLGVPRNPSRADRGLRDVTIWV
jgi:hypothetical protein